MFNINMYDLSDLPNKVTYCNRRTGMVFNYIVSLLLIPSLVDLLPLFIHMPGRHCSILARSSFVSSSS